MEIYFPLLVLNKKRNLMIRNSLTALIVSFILTLAIVSCGKKNQHYIEKIIEKMEKGGTSEEIVEVELYTVDSLNFVSLDSLGLTKQYINAWIKLYVDKSGTEKLVKDSKRLIDRLEKQSPENIEAFIKVIAHNNALREYPDATAAIVAYAYGIDVPADGYSEIATRLLVSTRLPGNKAPQIEGLQSMTGVNSTLILFYDGSCRICQHLLDELADNYSKLTERGIRVVTISADGSNEAFEQNIRKYPWPDKLCDYQSFSGINFKRFGIAAIPEMLVIDKDGMVVDQYRNLQETKLLN